MRKCLEILLVALAAVSCSKTPSGIIEPEEMAQLMADIHTGEAVVDMNRRDYPTDSARQAFKQSVYARHGFTSAQVDSSFVWYGRNISYYMEVYDRTIEILEHRLIETGNRIAAEAALSVAGDSVDVWSAPKFISVGDRVPSKAVTFRFGRDENWERGDMYTWRAKVFNNSDDASSWTMVAEYADGTVEFLDQNMTGDGWKEMTLITDSTLDLTRIYGAIEAVNRPGTSLRFDSIEMVRKRVNPERYTRRYSLRKLYKVFDPVEIKNDTVAAAKE